MSPFFAIEILLWRSVLKRDEKCGKLTDICTEGESVRMMAELLIKFTVYSFLGWLCETVYCSVGQRKFVYRGFLNGPVCPIYGFGALLVLFFLMDVKDNLLALFTAGMVVTTVLEYLTSFLMEKLFHAKWWDYSNKPFNIHGRVCLLNSVLFGMLAVLLAHFVAPAVDRLTNLTPAWLLPWVAGTVLVLFVADTVASVFTVLHLGARLKALQAATDTFVEERRRELREKRSALQSRLVKAYPNLHSLQYDERLQEIREALRLKKERRKNRSKK